MSGKKTKQLRRECCERLGRSPLRADGHVAMRSTLVRENRNGRSILRRAWEHLKPSRRAQISEFRFFKRHGCTPAEQETNRRSEILEHLRHAEEVERNNDHMAELQKSRAMETSSESHAGVGGHE